MEYFKKVNGVYVRIFDLDSNELSDIQKKICKLLKKKPYKDKLTSVWAIRLSHYNNILRGSKGKEYKFEMVLERNDEIFYEEKAMCIPFNTIEEVDQCLFLLLTCK